jgi:hypothetical protein
MDFESEPVVLIPRAQLGCAFQNAVHVGKRYPKLAELWLLGPRLPLTDRTARSDIQHAPERARIQSVAVAKSERCFRLA